MSSENGPSGEEQYDATSATFGSDEERQRQYNELSVKKTLGTLSPEEAEKFAALESARDELKNAPISPEDSAWLQEYRNKQGRADFDPSPEEINRFRNLQNLIR